MKRLGWATGLYLAASLAIAGCNGGGGGGLFGAGGQPTGEGTGQQTVLLKVFTDVAHMRSAATYKQRLEEALRWKGLIVVSQADRSELYWGRFETAAEATPTLKKAQAYRAQNGLQLFANAMITLLPGEEDEGPPEWEIRRNPGLYSLLINVYQDAPMADPPFIGQKRYAVQACRELRAQGFQAYYHHGPRSSSVTIGSFGRKAFRWGEKLVPVRGEDPVKVTWPVAVSPELLALRKRFPHRGWNGRSFKLKVKDALGIEKLSTMSAPSVPVLVPGKKD